MGAVDNPEFSGFVGTTGNVYREWSPECQHNHSVI